MLDGFTITGDNANGSIGNNFGGGMFNYMGSPTLANLTPKTTMRNTAAGCTTT